jgi:SAM-dependent methyltransferase
MDNVNNKIVGKVIYKKRPNCGFEGKLCDKCDNCARKIASVPDFESDSGIYDIYFCPKVGLGYTSPYPTLETAGFLYEDKNTSDFDARKNNVFEMIKDWRGQQFFLSLIKDGKDQKKVKHVLDYGTGNGRFARLAGKVFVNAMVDAVDYQLDPGDGLQQALSKRVRYLYVDKLKNINYKYDLIFLRHVIEHTDNPISLLKELASKLSDQGVIYIEVPNLNCGCSKVFGKYWPGYYVPRHIYHYTRQSLELICVRAGLNYSISENEIPYMGNMISYLSKGKHYGGIAQISGAILYPLQIIINKAHNGQSCLNVTCRK